MRDGLPESRLFQPETLLKTAAQKHNADNRQNADFSRILGKIRAKDKSAFALNFDTIFLYRGLSLGEVMFFIIYISFILSNLFLFYYKIFFKNFISSHTSAAVLSDDIFYIIFSGCRLQPLYKPALYQATYALIFPEYI